MLLTRIAAVSCLSGTLVIGPAAEAFGASSKVTKTCAILEGLQDDLTDVASPEDLADFGGDAFTTIGDTFAKAAKTAPKSVKGSLKKLASFYRSVGDADNAAEAAQELAGNAQRYAKASTKFATFLATKCSGSSTGSSSRGSAGGSSGRGGTLTIGDETIDLDRSLCYLEQQTAAGQDIDLTAQAFGTNDGGDDVSIDFTRYAEGGQFEGDDLSILVGNVGASDASNYSARLDYGAVDRSGSTLSLSDADVVDDEGMTTTVSFEIDC
jgi:hypothetical protein